MSDILVTKHFKDRARSRCGIDNFDSFLKRMMSKGIVLYNAMGFKSKKILFSKYIYDQSTDTISVMTTRKVPYALVTIYRADETAWFPRYKRRNQLKELPKARDEFYEPVFQITEGDNDGQTSSNS